MIRLRAEGYKSDRIDELASLISAHTDHRGTIVARVVPREEVRSLNKKYSHKDTSTDVLSFSYLEDNQPHDGEDLGDIVISREHISSQAREAATDEETEFLLLLMHGTLHILGYDHADTTSREKMDELQAYIMGELGLAYRNFGWRN